VARYWSIITAATAVQLSAHPSPLVITTKLAASILGGGLFGGGVLPAQYCPCGPKQVKGSMKVKGTAEMNGPTEVKGPTEVNFTEGGGEASNYYTLDKTHTTYTAVVIGN